MKVKVYLRLVSVVIALYFCASCKVSVSNRVSEEADFVNLKITLEVNKSATIIGETDAKFTALGTYDNKAPVDITDKVTFKLSDESIINLSSSGYVSTTAEGSLNLIATLAGKTSNEIPFTVFPLQTDFGPPLIVTPSSGKIIGDAALTSSGVQFAWSHPKGANSYVMEIHSDASYTSLIYTVSLAADKNFDFVSGIFSSSAYYWRVKADISVDWQTKDNQGNPLIFYTYDKILYIDGDSAVADPANPWEKEGSKARPFKRIQPALNLAKSIGISEVQVAATTTPYDEALIMQDGVYLRGGYESTGWTRNIAGNETKIQVVDDDSVIAVFNVTTGTIEGFTIHGLKTAVTITVTGGGSAFSLSQNKIIPGVATTGVVNAIIVQNNSQVLIENNVIQSVTSFGTEHRSIHSESSSPRILKNTINGPVSPGGYYGIELLASKALVLENTFTGGVTSNVTASVGVSSRDGDLSIIVANTITSPSSPNSVFCYGVTVRKSSPALYHNQINTLPCSISQGIFIESGNPVIVSNIIRILDSGTTTASFAIVNGGYPKLYNNTVASGNHVGGFSQAYREIQGRSVLKNNIFFTNAGSNATVIIEVGITAQPYSLQNNLLFNGNTLYNDDISNLQSTISTVINDSSNNGILNGAPDNELDAIAPISSGNKTLTPAQSINDVFAAGYSYNDLATWIIKANGPADLDSSGGWSAGDIGALNGTNANLNFIPYVDAGSFASFTVGGLATLSGSSTDTNIQNGGIVSNQWLVDTKPGGSSCTNACFSQTNILNPVFTPDAVGVYILKLTSTDNGLNNDGMSVAAHQFSDTMQVDVCSIATGPVYTSADSFPIAIPDNDLMGISSSINICGRSEAVTVSSNSKKMTVTIDISHTYVSDLIVALQSPQGRVLKLSVNNGGFGNNYTGTIFDDYAASAITAGAAPFNGGFTPVELFNKLNGENPNGSWLLRVADTSAIVTGQINSWSITFQ